MNQQTANAAEYFGKAEQCPVRNILDRFGDKWSVLVLLVLGDLEMLRFNQIHQTLGDISQKMLSVTLKHLEADGLISRQVYPVIPPKVEYRLTPLGQSLLPLLGQLTQWALGHAQEILQSRAEFAQRQSNR